MKLLLRSCHVGDEASSEGGQVNSLPRISVFSPTLFSNTTRLLYTNDLPTSLLLDNLCCSFQAKTFAELKCSLTADLAH